jgi:metal-responsive CopG/Arc/MetJ family transcriptional regulator
MTQKSDAKFRKIAVSLESEVVQKLDNYAERKSKGNRSAAANYLLSALQKKSP